MPKNRPEKKESNMKKAVSRKRKSIDFSKGIRGKYVDGNLVIVGASPNDKQHSTDSEASARAVLKRVSRVLDSAGNSKRDLEDAVSRARDLIASVHNV